MLKILKLSACGLIAAFAASSAFASDWPQYLGPERDGVVHDSIPLARSWPQGGPKVLWETPVGPGYGGAAIYGDSVFLLDRVGNTDDILRRINLDTGKDVWQYEYPAPFKSEHSGGRSTPATDGKYVFSIGPLGQLSAVNFSDGTLVWKKDLFKEWEVNFPRVVNWGEATSPLLYGDWVIVAPWGQKAALVAYDKATGNVAWSTPNPADIVPDYTSPVPMTLGGRGVILTAGKQGYLIGVDAQTGKQLFSYYGYVVDHDVGVWTVPSPVVVGDGRIFITGGYEQGAEMIKVVPQPDSSYTVVTLWRNKNMGTKCPQALLWNGYIYGNCADIGGGLRCITLDGQVKWDSKAAGGPTFDLGNLIIADGLIYIIDGVSGDLYMAEATPDGYKQLGKASFLRPPEPWAPPALKDGKLIIRDMHKMFCLDVAAPR